MSVAPIKSDPCPLCAGERALPLAVGTRHGIAAPAVLCHECGMVFQNPIPTQQILDEFYRTRYRETYSGSSTPNSDFLEEQFEHGSEMLERVRPRLRPGASVLDVGCGPGATLEPFRAAGFRVVGLEPGPYGAWGASNLGLDVRSGGVDELRSWSERFDLVILSFVLEHLRDPVDALRSVSHVVSESGFVHVEVPDLLGNHGRLRDYVHFAHLSYFTPSTIGAAIARSGMAPGPVDAAGRYSLWVEATPAGGRDIEIPTAEKVDAFVSQLARNERRARVEYVLRGGAKVVLRAVGQVSRRFGGSVDGPEEWARRTWRSLRAR